jgi:hypothetical protein
MPTAALIPVQLEFFYPRAFQNDVGTLLAIISPLNTRPACAPVNASIVSLAAGHA